MIRLARVVEGDPLPAYHTLIKIHQTILEPWGSGTNTRTVYVCELRDDRFWLSDEQKQAAAGDGQP